MDLVPAYTIDLTAICVRAEGIPPETSCAEAYRLFSANERQPALAVIDADKQPRGIIYRDRLMLKLAGVYGRPLFESMPVTRLMDTAPLVIDQALTLDSDFAAALEQISARNVSCFVIAKAGRYVGLGNVTGLLRIVTDHLQHQALEAEAARREAEAAAHGKSRFLANMTHELRTPLNGVIGFGQLLEAEAHGPLGAPEYKLYAKDIVASGEHLIAIISDILDLAKIEAGRVELHERFIDLRELAGRSLRMVAPLAAGKSIRLHGPTNARAWTLRADERRLQQALINLLSNAIKFTPAGGDVGVEFGANAGWAWIEVWDKGCGIAEQDLARLFKPFEQLGDVKSRGHEGTGLGLTITKALLQSHGGEVEFKSTLGQGTRAKLLLPRSRLLADEFAWSSKSRVEFIDPPEAEAV